MDLIRARTVTLVLEGEGVVRAVVGSALVSLSGFGSSVPDALRDLAHRIDRAEDVKVWVPRRAKPYVRSGKTFLDCPECGHPHVVPDEAYKTIAFICEQCGEPVDVEP